MKYVLVTGGVVSGLGKGVTASSIGVLLKACGHRVTCIKIGEASRQHWRQLQSDRFQIECIRHEPCAADPYLNTDAGTMSPFEHGEVFVLDDGGEVSLASGYPSLCVSCFCPASIARPCSTQDILKTPPPRPAPPTPPPLPSRPSVDKHSCCS